MSPCGRWWCLDLPSVTWETGLLPCPARAPRVPWEGAADQGCLGPRGEEPTPGRLSELREDRPGKQLGPAGTLLILAGLPPTHIAGLSGYLEEMATLSPQGQAGRPSSPGALRIRPRCLMAESEARCLKHWGAFLTVADPRVGGSHGLSAGGRNASNQAALHLRSLGTRVRPNARWKRSL